MKVGIYGQYYKEDSEEYILNLLEVLQVNKAEVFLEAGYLEQIKESLDINTNYRTFASFEDLDNSFDLFLSLGGDGTMLRTVLFVRDLDIPILGINTGRLGFLATVQKENIQKAIEEVMQNGFEVKKRALLQITTNTSMEDQTEVNFALNEIAVSRKNTTSMITIATWLDGEYLTSYWADGLIVATPTGSTGYSLSCNGPVIAPSTDAFVLTPIAPHNLNARPLVIPDKTKIKLKVTGREDNFLVSLDSRIATLNNETEMIIERAPFTIKLVDLKGESFLKTLRKKLLWGEDRRN
ncbi:NAD kinase [Galbibacter pacificus]|uniref:NAD kinase n=1 Tax=Galbibacter pacificus TaxID=2996052 RepID=A0ABT6FT92_9FLAO|nr:NAD kinase [Galbibacter pacificus]MDG3582407.1 NAD kinase [Galbibacter pacificus]MDG3586475.1 NAD kinase [Galbibacter pacificus]